MKNDFGWVLKPVPALLAGLLMGAGLAHADGVVDLGTVSAQGAAGTADTGNADTTNTSTVWTTKQKMNSVQNVESVSQDQIQLFGPGAGGAQALTILPNVQITGPNAGSASGRSTISMNGARVGYNSIPGSIVDNAITAELDGIPLNSLSQNTGFHSPMIPMGALLSGINVVQGPGNASDRWFNTLAGSINFIPVQPSDQASATAELSYGSFDSVVGSAVLNTGVINGWATELGVGNAHSQSIRNTSEYLPSRTTDVFLKTQKKFDNGLISFGLYSVYDDEYRPNMIPTTDVASVTTTGNGTGGPLYSQQSSGFYSTLPRSQWFKHITIEDYVAWSNLELNITPDFTLTNSMWFRDGYVVHFRINSFQGYPNEENFNEHSATYGDKLQFKEAFAKNNVLSFGAYAITSRAENSYTGYNSNGAFDGSTNAAPDFLNQNTTQSTDYALFLQENYTAFDRLSIVPAVRLHGMQTDFANNSPQALLTFFPGSVVNTPINLVGTTGLPYTVGTDAALNQSTTMVKAEPSLGINFKVNNAWNMYADYDITYQNPPSNLYDSQSTINISTLQPIKSTNYDIGVRYDQKQVLGLDDLNGSLGYYHAVYANEAIPRTVFGSPFSTFGYGSASYDSVALSINAIVNHNWTGFVNVGWDKSNWDSFYSTTSNSYFNGTPVSNNPTGTFNAGATYTANITGGTIDTTLWDQYFGHSYLYNNLIGAPTKIDNPGYNLVNLSVNAHLTSPGWLQSLLHPQVTTLSLEAMNLLDKQYNSTEYISSGGLFGAGSAGAIVAYPGAPRSFFVTLRMDY